MNEYLHRRVAIEDVVTAHLLAAERAPAIGFRKYIISATTPFVPEDLAALRFDAPRVVAALRIMKPSTTGEVGGCLQALDGFMSTTARGMNLTGSRDIALAISSAG